MFTLQQIKDAHSKVKSGADFPAYVQAIIKLGVSGYETFVTDGHTVYFGKDGYRIQTEMKYPAMDIATKANNEAFTSYLKMHQQGQTDYPSFCRHCAETGVEAWKVNMAAMTCTYYDLAGNKMLEETISTV